MQRRRPHEFVRFKLESSCAASSGCVTRYLRIRRANSNRTSSWAWEAASLANVAKSTAISSIDVVFGGIFRNFQ